MGVAESDPDGRLAFGQAVRTAMAAKGYSQGELGRQLGRLPTSQRVFDARGVGRILAGGPVKLDAELVTRLLEVLAPFLDPPAAWFKAGLRAPWMTEDHYRVTYAASQAPRNPSHPRRRLGDVA